MRLRIMSDVHLEFWSFTPEPVPADVIVMAGDIAEGAAGLQWAREQFPREAIVYVIGNHELYGQRLPDAIDQLSAIADGLGIHLLENRSVVIDGVRFLGATLWTDYALYAKNEEEVGRYMFLARRAMNDYRYIRFGPKRKKRRDRVLPGQLLDLHRASRTWLTEQLAIAFAGKTVVVTHHAPYRLSVPPQFDRDPLTACYVSHLPDLVRPPVALWIHGHIHDSLDYEVDGTRVLANPRGYKPPDENPAFEPNRVVEI